MQLSGIDLHTLSDTNRISVLRQIHEKKLLSRTQLASETGLSLSAVSRITKDLINDGLIEEVGLGDSSGGRKPVYLKAVYDAGYVIGVDFGKTKVVAGLFDFTGDLVFENITSVSGKDYLPALYTAIDICVDHLGKDKRLLMIFCGVRGYIDRSSGSIVFSNTFGWENIPLTQLLEERYGVPVGLEINAQLSALGEWKSIYEDLVDNLVFITTSWGICAGVISKREMFCGSRGMAGEIGNTVNFNGNQTYNLEQACGGQMLIRRGIEKWDDPSNFLLKRLTNNQSELLTVEQIVTAANSGDVFAGTLINEAAEVLACGLLNVVYTYNPEVIVIGGLLAELGELILSPAKEKLAKKLHPVLVDQVTVRLTALNGKASLMGAAEAAFQRIFASPIDRDTTHCVTL